MTKESTVSWFPEDLNRHCLSLGQALFPSSLQIPFSHKPGHSGAGWKSHCPKSGPRSSQHLPASEPSLGESLTHPFSCQLPMLPRALISDPGETDSEGIQAWGTTAGQKFKLLSGLLRKPRPSEGHNLHKDVEHTVQSG